MHENVPFHSFCYLYKELNKIPFSTTCFLVDENIDIVMLLVLIYRTSCIGIESYNRDQYEIVPKKKKMKWRSQGVGALLIRSLKASPTRAGQEN